MPCPWIGFEIHSIEPTLLLLQEASPLVGDDMKPSLSQRITGNGNRVVYEFRTWHLLEELFLQLEALVHKLHQIVMLL